MRNPQEPRDAVAGHLGDEEVSDCALGPEQAAAGVLEHVAGCTECAARVEELSGLLVALAALPEPEIPESVLIRLDATIEQAWKSADEEAARTSARARTRRARGWRRLIVPITALGVLAGGVAGVGYLISYAGLHGGSASHSAGSASGSERVTAAAGEGAPNALASADAGLTALARQAFATGPTHVPRGTLSGGAGSAGPTQTGMQPHSQTQNHGAAQCAQTPTRAGYTVWTEVPETYTGQNSTLVLYRNDEEPASSTAYLAVVYAGSCPDAAAPILDQGLVRLS